MQMKPTKTDMKFETTHHIHKKSSSFDMIDWVLKLTAGNI